MMILVRPGVAKKEADRINAMETRELYAMAVCAFEFQPKIPPKDGHFMYNIELLAVLEILLVAAVVGRGPMGSDVSPQKPSGAHHNAITRGISENKNCVVDLAGLDRRDQQASRARRKSRSLAAVSLETPPQSDRSLRLVLPAANRTRTYLRSRSIASSTRSTTR